MSTQEIELTALDGTNPLGFLAALGVLDVLHRAGRTATLRWTDDLVPTPVLHNHGAADEDDLVRLGVPGADWLAFLGLVFFPTCIRTGNGKQGSLRTSGCDRGWKRSALRWPLWTVPLERDTVWSLVGDSAVVGEDRRQSPDRRRTLSTQLRARGVRQVMEAPIRRSEQGGYGSFGGASVLVQGG